MYDPKSRYVKKIVCTAPYAERERVKQLLAIERYASSGRISGWIHGMMIEQLWREENAAFRAILAELNPRLLSERAREEELRAQGRRRMMYERLIAQERDREAWIAAGGTI
jgi:hypothetical protein